MQRRGLFHSGYAGARLYDNLGLDRPAGALVAEVDPRGPAAAGGLKRGDVIAIKGPQGEVLGRGLTNYASAEARLICRKPSSEFETLLGFVAEPEMVHRDNLVLV